MGPVSNFQLPSIPHMAIWVHSHNLGCTLLLAYQLFNCLLVDQRPRNLDSNSNDTRDLSGMASLELATDPSHVRNQNQELCSAASVFAPGQGSQGSTLSDPKKLKTRGIFWSQGSTLRTPKHSRSLNTPCLEAVSLGQWRFVSEVKEILVAGSQLAGMVHWGIFWGW